MRKRSDRGDGKRVDGSMTLRIMVFDVEEVGGFFKRWDVPVEVSEPFMNMRVT